MSQEDSCERPDHASSAAGLPAQMVSPTPDARSCSRQIEINGRNVEYQVETWPFSVRSRDGKTVSTVTSFTYRTTERAADERPVVFIFNGGPGSSSGFLHFSGIASKRVDFEVGDPVQPPFRIIDSEFSLLDVADLVFIDPAATGYSPFAQPGSGAQVYGVDADARVTAAFIRHWLYHFKRWNSPRFVVGESYGSIRAAVVCRELMGGIPIGEFPAVTLNGVILVGQAMNLTQTTQVPANDVAFTLLLPSMAATAWYHKTAGIGTALEDHIRRARDFALHRLLPVLIRGNTAVDRDRNAVAIECGELTGLKSKYVLDRDLRITAREFAQELLSDRGLLVGVYDGRMIAGKPSGALDIVGTDPSMTQLGPLFANAINVYLTNDLGFADQAYRFIDFSDSLEGWDWNVRGHNRYYMDVSSILGNAMRLNSRMRVLCVTGRFDLMTPMMAAEWELSHGGMPVDRTRLVYQDGGHMPYVGREAAQAFATAIRNLITDTT